MLASARDMKAEVGRDRDNFASALERLASTIVGCCVMAHGG